MNIMMEPSCLPTSSEGHSRQQVRKSVLELLTRPAQPTVWGLLEYAN